MDFGRIKLSSFFKRKLATFFWGAILSLAGILVSILSSDYQLYDYAFSFLTIFYTCLLVGALFISFNQHYLIEDIRHNYKNTSSLFFKDHLNGTINEVNSSMIKLMQQQDNFLRDLVSLDDTSSSPTKNHVKQNLDRLLQTYHEQFFKGIKKAFNAVCNNVCHIINHHLIMSGVSDLKISSSVKQLSAFYIKGANNPAIVHRYETDISKLKVTTAYRDTKSYTKLREVGKSHYTVTLNDTFRECLTQDCEKAIYKRDNLEEAFKKGLYRNENSTFSEHYNSTACVPIYRVTDLGTIYYGFLSIDCKANDERVVFEREDCLFILQTFAKLLALVYYYIDNRFLKSYVYFKNGTPITFNNKL